MFFFFKNVIFFPLIYYKDFPLITLYLYPSSFMNMIMKVHCTYVGDLK